MTTIDRLRYPSISKAVTCAAGINPEPTPRRGVTRWTAQAPARRVPRRAADLMEKRARPRSKRPRPRSGRGVGCTRDPCRQASLRVSPRRGAGRPHPPAMGSLSVIQWGAAPGPVAFLKCLGPRCSRRRICGRASREQPRRQPLPRVWMGCIDIDCSACIVRAGVPYWGALLGRQVDAKPIDGDVLWRQPVSPLVTVARLL